MPSDAPRGRPPHQPTEQTREIVRKRAGLGLPQDAIARCLNITDNTLRKHYSEELERGVDEANSEVAQSMWLSATGREVQNDGTIKRVPVNTALAIWWSKTRMQWKEPPRDIEEIRDGGGNTTIIVRGGLDPVQQPKSNGHAQE